MPAQAAVIDGKLVEGPETLDVLDPSTGTLLDRTLRGTGEHVDAAVAAARAASREWAHTPYSERSAILRRIGELIRRDRGEFALLESQDTGKPLAQACADTDVAARYFEYYANTMEAFFGHSLPPNGDFVAYTRHVPFGVTGHIIPWNYPLQIGCRTIAPAIAVGNCAVVKPAEEAPLSVLKVARTALEAGLPAGVLNVVPGLGAQAGAALAGHAGIDHLSFTGSVPVGAAVAHAAAENVIPVVLELGGKSPNIVFPDADLDAAIPVIVKSMLQNAGQTCSAGSRLLVHEEVRDEVLARIDEALRGVRIGPGPQDLDLGPLISAKQRDRVTQMVQRAADSGARQLGGPGQVELPEGGFYFPPTVFTDVDPAQEIAQEEVFGPVLAAMSFGTVDEAIQLANGTQYGLIAAAWTRNLDVAHVMAEEIRAGQVYLNTYGGGGGVEYTFGGFGKSGYGREKGFEALKGFCQTKTIVTKVTR
ncbi:aldehyde dehydrogenase family protein [Saccharopolyspora spinosa]|uniref:Aldehyde dehydrogenase n=1 Tax=Saccharopolyspora spinosa TaxID=60894 RepID=Q6JHN1_SACSN|nr:aldehyde dehydrogenase family protein [Saccharopolyspora spinosa]AAS00426.1 aldehyde dehydrogenase [Saccharopolyspora spinosa NRRL 18395]PKW16146.1 aldehyde dehydrogenase (NAD+)/betaine-aldehyde dehydrogenase [Saccharopolyspora spinosa]